MRGILRKMRTEIGEPIQYKLPIGDELIPLNERIGKPFSLTHTGEIFCINCARKTRKSFAQGYCYPCFKRLAECDLCIMRPHTCHHHLGTCRDEDWAAQNCMTKHIVYLANSSAIKVGITRATQLPTRWIDQGASQALALFSVASRLHSGLLEAALAKHLSDRTDWRKMLTGNADFIDLKTAADKILTTTKTDLTDLQKTNPTLTWQRLHNEPLKLNYPVNQYPKKPTAMSLDKTPKITGELQGIKGQYLILEQGVINIRKFAGYEVEVE